MQIISNICSFIATLELIAAPVLLVIWIIRKIRKKPKWKWFKWFWISFAAVITVGVLTSPATWCKHENRLVETKEASCTEDGYTKYHCDLCGRDTTETIKRLGHDMREVSRIKPTSESDGEFVTRCSRCGYEETEVLKKLNEPSKETTSNDNQENSEKSETVPKQETEKEEDTVGTATFEEIYKAYKENELVADDLYKNNRYRVTAKIDGMTNDGLFNLTGGATLTLEKTVGNTIVIFYAEFEKEQEENLKTVKVGDTITFVGECLSAGSWIDCELVVE
jgi:hypothetical protein|nr:MAG TPA: putative nucleic acid-binding lipoprotein.1, putative nucleic acid-binding lipoprotein [Caudoviricetes sp.]